MGHPALAHKAEPAAAPEADNFTLFDRNNIPEWASLTPFPVSVVRRVTFTDNTQGNLYLQLRNGDTGWGVTYEEMGVLAGHEGTELHRKAYSPDHRDAALQEATRQNAARLEQWRTQATLAALAEWDGGMI